ncbi:MAG: hypothetical protein IJE05_02605 [Clostridia bacterium]|nr:hypothetical protein [Clostridia bacterium]
MEEKKVIKISLSTVFLVIAIILIFIMAYYIYVEKANANKEIASLEANAINMQNTINDLQGKIDNISNTINSSTNKESNNSQSNNTSSNENIKFSDDEIKKCLQEYLELVGIREGSPLGMLVKLGLCDYSDYDNANKTDDNYVKTNIKYSDYKEKMLNYVTEEWFNTNFENGYKQQDGLLYYFDGGASGIEFEVKDITLKGDYSDLAYIAEVYNVHLDDTKELENIEFHISDNNGKCVISYCD